MGRKAVIAVALAAGTLSACSYNAVPPTAVGSNFYSTNEEKITGRFLFSVDDTSLSKMRVADAVKGYICGAHKVPIDAEEPLKSSIQQTLPLVFEEIEMVATAPGSETMRRDGVAGFVLVKVDNFQPTVSYSQKFFGADANASVDLSLGVVVTGQEGKLLATSVNASRSKMTDGGMFCEGGADAMAQATSLAIREALERVAERLSGSQKVREAARTAAAGGGNIIPAAYAIPTDAGPALPPLAPKRVTGKKHKADLALIIGVDRYARLPRADFAENDAARFAEYAVNGLGLDPGKIKVLKGDQATRNEVMKAISTWAKAEMSGGESTVHVFFSGHGLTSSDGKEAYLMPADGDVTVLKDSGIKREEIIERLNEAGAKNIVMMLDTCYSGASRSGQTLMAYARPVVLASVAGALPSNVTILSAAGNDQISSSLPRTKHGALSYFAMKGLEGEADKDGDHRITTGELHSFVKDRVAREAVRQGREQVPQLVGDGKKVLVEW